MDTSSLRNLKEKLVKSFRQECTHVTGIYLAGDNAFVTEVFRADNNTFQVEFADKMTLPLNEETDFSSVVLCMDDCDVYYYHKEFPAMEQEELKSAIYWDISSNEPFEGEYMESCYQEDKESNKYLLGAVDKNQAEDIISVLKDNNITVSSIVAAAGKNIELKTGLAVIENIKCHIPEFWADYFIDKRQLYALYAAVSGFKNIGLEFNTGQKKIVGWNFLRLTACTLAFSILLSGIASAVSIWQLSRTETEMKQAEQEFSLLSDVWEAKQNTDSLIEKFKLKNKLLQDLGKDSWPVYAILVHLGCNTVDGAWITDLSMEKDKEIILQGKAVTYNSLVKYYKLLEADKEFFTGGAVLEKSDTASNGNVDFSIKLKL